MGIRFYCPNGHKLNVKEFQAGRRGICPFCGTRILIPTQSTRPASKTAARRGVPAQEVDDDSESSQASDSSPDILPGEPPSLPGDPTGGKMLGPSTPVGTPPVAGVVAPPTAPTVVRPAASSATAGPQASVRPEQPRPVAPAPTAQHSPVAPAPAPHTLRPVPTQPVTAPAQPVVPQPAPPQPVPPQPPASEPPDPIFEAPEMIWYVRPPSGGQFGPASGDLMRTWLSEGRISADSLVWREGWRDWQEAGAVFPKLRSNQIIDFLEAAPVAPVASATHAHRTKSRQSSDRSQIALLVVLSLAVIVLVVVFLLVLFRPS
jgi:hypothetical protein